MHLNILIDYPGKETSIDIIRLKLIIIMYGWISDTNFNFNWSENHLRDLIFRDQNYFENYISVIYLTMFVFKISFIYQQSLLNF